MILLTCLDAEWKDLIVEALVQAALPYVYTADFNAVNVMATEATYSLVIVEGVLSRHKELAKLARELNEKGIDLILVTGDSLISIAHANLVRKSKYERDEFVTLVRKLIHT